MKPPLNSRSQAGQDKFVYELIPVTTGTFLDIGCQGYELSNTLGLEELGWTGILIDEDQSVIERWPRKNQFVRADARKLNWLDIYPLPKEVHYLSLDVDDATLATLQNMPLNTLRFKIITIEHDVYRLPESNRESMREILSKAGYILICGDVRLDDDRPFEDWWVALELEPAASYFRCRNFKGKQIVSGL